MKVHSKKKNELSKDEPGDKIKTKCDENDMRWQVSFRNLASWCPETGKDNVGILLTKKRDITDNHPEKWRRQNIQTQTYKIY